MKEATLIFPHQLFRHHPSLDRQREVFLIEHKRYFLDFAFHRKKLVLHRATMRAYQEYLLSCDYRIRYFEFDQDWRANAKGYRLFAARPYDRTLETELPDDIEYAEPPAFLGGELKKQKKYHMAKFYQAQRKNFDILMENGKPAGGKWSYDADNRKPLPKGHQPPPLPHVSNKYIDEASGYVQKHFSDNPGNISGFRFPVTFGEAEQWLERFIEERLQLFGDYEDAIVEQEGFLYHSVLSPLLNIGLLTPQEVLEAVIEADAPINSVEGFVRQVIGWREFILQVYLLEGEKQRHSNFFRHHKKIPQSFYNATTGVPPVDNVISKVLENAYCHHIERLMVLGNFMLLSEYDPREIYRWFMEMFIDAYDWVMVPNLFGMSQYADGGLMSTKPYISSSNYILKMGDFARGDWCAIWDDLYWSFLDRNEKALRKNPRMALMMKQLDRKKAK